MQQSPLIKILIAVSLLVFSAEARSDFYGINCGGPSYTSPQGELFIPDTLYQAGLGIGYLGGDIPPQNAYKACGGSEGMTELFWNCREGEFSYLFDLPEAYYSVTLYISELVFHGKDFRSFSAVIEADTVIRDLDVFERVGRQYVLPQRFLAECSDGLLNIDFFSGLGGGTVCAIAVRTIEPDTTAPEGAVGLTVTGGYEMNILDWAANWEGDLAGYEIHRRDSGGEWQLQNESQHGLSRYIDYNVIPGAEYDYQVSVIDLWGNESELSDIESASPVRNEDTGLPRYTFEISDQELYLLNQDVYSNEYRDADITLEGNNFPDSEIRYRGGSSRPRPKKSYKMNLPGWALLNERDKFNLLGEIGDISILRNRLCLFYFDESGCLNPASRHVHLEMNGEYAGVYVDVEVVDNFFLVRNNLSPVGNLYECNWGDLSVLNAYEDYQFAYPKSNHEESSWDDIIEFIEWINLSPDEEFSAEAGTKFALDEYLDMYVVLIAAADWDFVIHNYFMYSNPADGHWYFIPWDHNLSFNEPLTAVNFGTEDSPVPGPGYWNKLLTRVLDDTLFRYAYCKKLQRFLQSGFTVEQSLLTIDSLHNSIEYDAVRDIFKYGWESPNMFLYNGPDQLHSFVEARIPFLLSEIPLYILEADLSPYFRLNEIQTDNLTTIQDEAGDFDPWIEIHNSAPVELDLGGFVLNYQGQTWIFPEEAVIDAEGFILVWADGEPAEGELHTSFMIQPGAGSLQLICPTGIQTDSAALPLTAADEVYARTEDGAGEWIISNCPTPETANFSEIEYFPLLNEFLAINDSILADEAGEFDDWTELYNPYEFTITTGGLYLTDNFDEPAKWAFPDTSVPPLGYLLIWCDGDTMQGDLHAAFSISGEGEELGIFASDGVSPISMICFGEQSPDTSFGNYPDGGCEWMLMTPSPMEQNRIFYVGIQDIHKNNDTPREFQLRHNYPNPFNYRTVFRLELPVASKVRLMVYDILGRQVSKLEVAGYKLEAGYHEIVWNAEGVSSGVYLVRMEVDGLPDRNVCPVRKVVLVK